MGKRKNAWAKATKLQSAAVVPMVTLAANAENRNENAAFATPSQNEKSTTNAPSLTWATPETTTVAQHAQTSHTTTQKHAKSTKKGKTTTQSVAKSTPKENTTFESFAKLTLKDNSTSQSVAKSTLKGNDTSQSAARSTPKGKNTSRSLTPSAQAGESATPSLTTPAPRDESDWDTHNWYGDMSQAQISKAKAAEAAETAAKAKKNEMDAKLKGWPWRGAPPQLVTAGPLFLNVWHELALPFNEQKNNPFINALFTEGLGEMIIDQLFQHHSSIWALAFTCQKVHSRVKITLGVWDLNMSNFNGCEQAPSATGDVDGRGLVAKNLIVTPLRSPNVADLHKSNCFYESQLWNTYRLCQTVKHRANHFQRIHLHRIPFLTTNLLEILIPQLTKLEVLGIYKCPLIHIGHGMELLNIISRDRPKGKEYQVSLDWFPNFHVGPDEDCPVEFFTGRYGVTWDDWQGETDRAIWALVIPFLAQCKKHGIDAVSSCTQFRRWLEAGPCWDVIGTLKAIVLAWNLQVPGSDLFNGDTNVDLTSTIRERPFPSRRLREDVPLSHYTTIYPKLTRAVIQMDRRNPQHYGNYNAFFATDEYLRHTRPEEFEWRFKPFKCKGCENSLPGICYQFPTIKNYQESTNYGRNTTHATDLFCLGCQLSWYLDTEKDHFKKEKRLVLDLWLEEGIDADGQSIYNTTDINKLLVEFRSGLPTGAVQNLDRLRLERANHLWFDREHEERQMPLTAQVLRSLRGNFLQAPQIGEWAKHVYEQEEKVNNPEKAKWQSGTRTSYLRGVRTHG